ncbi:MAG: proton-conducting transporter membrane subunit [Candidatus Eisenbacteria bacterium]
MTRWRAARHRVEQFREPVSTGTHPDHGRFMDLAGLDAALLASAVWGLAAAAILPLLAIAWPKAPAALHDAAPRFLGVLACLAAVGVGARGLAGGSEVSLQWWPGFPGQPFTVGPDALAAPFLLLFGLVGAASIAAHRADHDSPGAHLRLSLHLGFACLLCIVFATQHALMFLFAWEGMTLVSAALVAADPRGAKARSAAFTYLALSHVGAACIALALLTLSGHAGSYRFDTLSSAYAALAPGDAARLAWLFTIGFAVKLGLVPLHGWLPLAHPEAPAPVSALLSGVMVKAGLYGMLRFVWQLPGAPPQYWGTVLLVLGIASSLVGALYAAVESDAKRLLAWSTVKHAGVLAMGTGLAAQLAASEQPIVAGIALAATLYHVVGHGLAKSLAFLAVGEAVHSARSRSLEHLGGLARRMPRTGLAALIATIALCALPPLSCFPGEWLLFQALILGYSAGAGQLRLLAPFAAAGLALASALAVAAMVKLYGIGFLGRARSETAATATEAPRSVTTVLLIAAALPLAWGLAAPWSVAALRAPIAAVLPEFDAGALQGAGGLTLQPALLQASSISPFAAAALVGLFAGLAILWLRSGTGPHGVRRSPSWSCGAPLGARMQYSALGFTKPLRLIFQPVLRGERVMEVLEEGSPYFARPARVTASMPAMLERVVVAPLVRAVLWGSEWGRGLQTGSLHQYLGYLLATLVALLLWGR